ncbi:MAG: hypothetical protein ABH834_02300, partial [Candidatus Altiarchaeota archaeon]
TAIRNRLEKQDVYTTRKIPDLRRLGCEIINITHTEYNPITPYSIRKTRKDENPNIFFEIQTHTQRLSISAEKNYTEARRKLEEHIANGCVKEYFSRDDVKTIIFPLPISKVFMFFDYSVLMRKHFGLEADTNIICDAEIRITKPYEFERNEKRVYHALIENPAMRETKLAETLSMSRGSIHDMCQRFREEALFRTVRIPDLEKLGFEMIVFNHITLNPQLRIKDRKPNIERALNDGNHIMIIAGDMESSSLLAFRSYTEFQDIFKHLTEFGRKRGYLKQDPTPILFPFDDMQYFMKARFGKLVGNLLNVN